MKFLLIAPGVMPIPATGWGACENIVWDYYQTLTKLNHQVNIINFADPKRIIEEVVKYHFVDVIHIQYDDHAHLMPYLSQYCRIILMTTHFAYLTQEERWAGWRNIFNYAHSLPKNGFIFALSEEIRKIYIDHHINQQRVLVHLNSARDDLFNFKKEPEFANSSLCLGKIEPRKGQRLLMRDQNIFFAGRIEDKDFIITTNYLGEWNRETLYKRLTDYANLVLLSDGEADPLVVKEALMAGLGVVITKVASANLEINYPFIDLVERDQSNLLEVIERNRKKSLLFREEIRKYALKEFSYSRNIMKYLEKINKLIND